MTFPLRKQLPSVPAARSAEPAPHNGHNNKNIRRSDSQNTGYSNYRQIERQKPSLRISPRRRASAERRRRRHRSLQIEAFRGSSHNRSLESSPSAFRGRFCIQATPSRYRRAPHCLRHDVSLLRREAPDASYPGIALATLSLVVMPVLSRAKRRVAATITSRALAADASQTDICAYVSAILLAGLALNAVFGWWWVIPWPRWPWFPSW